MTSHDHGDEATPPAQPQASPRAHLPSSGTLLLCALLLCAATCDLALTSCGAPQAPSTADAHAWALTPYDLHAAPQARGLWRPGSAEPPLTRSPDPARWAPEELGAPRLEPSSPAPWQRVSFPQAAALPLFSAARVAIAPLNQPARARPCPRSADAWQCQPDPWAYVGPRDDMRVANKAERCIWAHALPQHTLTITYPDFAPSPDAALTFEVALADAVASDAPRPITLTVQHGEHTQDITHSAGRRGWLRQRLTLGERADLVVSVSVAQPGRHQLCYRFTSAPTTRSTP